MLGVVKRSSSDVCNAYLEQQSKNLKVAIPLKNSKKTAEDTGFSKSKVEDHYWEEDNFTREERALFRILFGEESEESLDEEDTTSAAR